MTYFQRIGEKIGSLVPLNANGKTSLYLFEENFNTEIYQKTFAEAVEEIREIMNSETIYLQLDNSRYHWVKEALDFYRKSNIKLIDWSLY